MKHNIIKFIAVFLIFAGFQIGTKACADTPVFDYSDKHKIIVLAKSGDPDALFKLGQAHYYGINSVKNLKVAEQFFVHASLKGNVSAPTYLDIIRETRVETLEKTTNKNKTVKQDSKRNPKTNGPESVRTNSVIVSSNKRVIKRSKMSERLSKPSRKNKKAKKAKAKLVNATQTKAKLKTKTLGENGKPKTDDRSNTVSRVSSVKASVQAHQEVVLKDNAEKVLSTVIVNPTNIYDADGYAFLKPLKFVFMVMFAALMILLFYVFIIRGKRLGLIPNDFDDLEYLTLNPDVRESGMNPRFHYIRYGKFEGRRYRNGF